MEEEVWKILMDNRGHCWNGALWEISNFGKVKKNGQLYVFKKRKYCEFSGGLYAHIAVAELFIPKPDGDGPWEIDHIDGDPWNNRVDNLRWVTHRENCNNPITRKRNSEAQTGKHHTEETRKKLSAANKGEKNPMYGKIGEKHPMYNKHHTKESKSKISNAIKGKYWFNNGVISVRAYECPPGFHQGCLKESKSKISNAMKGKHWFNNGINEIKAFECPPGFQQGRLKNSI